MLLLLLFIAVETGRNLTNILLFALCGGLLLWVSCDESTTGDLLKVEEDGGCVVVEW